VASSHTGNRGHEVRQASIVSAYVRGRASTHSSSWTTSASGASSGRVIGDPSISPNIASDTSANVTVNDLAIAGGLPQPPRSDTQYYLVTPSLEAVLTTIAASATPCSFALAPPPAGSTRAISAVTGGGRVTVPERLHEYRRQLPLLAIGCSA
jgi:hypothetical protein